jgi:DNA invertase Pin-like site-specific DNA recombinase
LQPVCRASPLQVFLEGVAAAKVRRVYKGVRRSLERLLGRRKGALKAAGCEMIRAGKASGTRRDGRTELQVLLDFLRAGDTLMVTRIDRLARSIRDLRERGVTLRATEQPIDTHNAAGKAFLEPAQVGTL